MKPRRTSKRRASEDDCVIPPAMPPEAAGQFVLNGAHHEEQAIREYVEWQTRDEKVTHAEKVKTERLRDRKLDAWDVRTDKDRYWVITNPTNLYSQSLFPSLDYTISFHVGLMERVWARQGPPVEGTQRRRLAHAWRRWTQAAEALDAAEEAEEFQAVGMRCRECLLAFIKAARTPDMSSSGKAEPKNGDLLGWSQRLAEGLAPGARSKAVRGYLKAIATEAWQLVNWLTHAENATRMDGEIALDATQAVLTAFGAALLRHERGAVDRCPACGSYRLTASYQRDLGGDSPYRTVCESCGWGAASGGAKGP